MRKWIIVFLTGLACLTFAAVRVSHSECVAISGYTEQATQEHGTTDTYAGATLSTVTEEFGSPSVDFDTIYVFTLPDMPTAVFVAVKDGCVVAQGGLPKTQYELFKQKHEAAND